MQSKELLVMANQHAYALTMSLMEDMRTAPFVLPAPRGNHLHWIIGHLLFSEGGFESIRRGCENPFENLQPQFGGQSLPNTSGSGFRPYGELLAELQTQQQSLVTMLESLTEADLDQPGIGCPPGFEAFFGTFRVSWQVNRSQELNACATASYARTEMPR